MGAVFVVTGFLVAPVARWAGRPGAVAGQAGRDATGV